MGVKKSIKTEQIFSFVFWFFFYYVINCCHFSLENKDYIVA